MWNPPASNLDWLVPLRLLIPVLGFGGMVVGLILIRRITRFGGDEVARWRYRDLDPEIDVERDDTLGDARRVARIELLIGGAWPLVILAALVMQPGSFRACSTTRPRRSSVWPLDGSCISSDSPG